MSHNNDRLFFYQVLDSIGFNQFITERGPPHRTCDLFDEVRYDEVWYGMVWYGMVWYGMVWYGMVWYGMVWYGMVWYGMVWYGMVWYDITDHTMSIIFLLIIEFAGYLSINTLCHSSSSTDLATNFGAKIIGYILSSK